MSKNNTASLPPFVQGRSTENSRWYMGSVMTFLVNSEQTNGAPEKSTGYPSFHRTRYGSRCRLWPNCSHSLIKVTVHLVRR